MRHTNLGFLFTVKVDNGFKGRQFILHNEEEVRAFGVSMNSVSNAVSSGVLLFGMEVKRVNVQSMQCEQYEDILQLFRRNKRYFNTQTQPVWGKVVDPGPYKGIEFSLYGTAEAERYFTKTGVLNATRSKRPVYRGCIFRTTSHRLAIPLHGNLTVEIAEYLEQKYMKNKEG